MTRLRLPFRPDPLLSPVCAGLLLLPVSNAIGQVPIYFASLFWLVHALRGRLPVHSRRTQLFLLAYAALLLASLLYAVRPEMGISKLNRLLFLPFAGAVAAAGGAKRTRWESILLAVVGGVALRGLYDLLRFPAAVFDLPVLLGHVFPAWDAPALREHLGLVREHAAERLLDAGNMTSPQFYLVGLCLLLGLRAASPQRLAPRSFWPLLLLFVTGILLHNKRGVWFASGATLLLWTLRGRQAKTLLLLCAAGSLALALPTVRARLAQIPDTLSDTHGSRVTLWKHVAPRLFERYPWGLGFNGSTHAEFREVLPAHIHLEPGLRHLHNNPLQLRLELGPHGLALWLAWMASSLLLAFRTLPPSPLLSLSVACAFLGLLLNGLVEYNFGDSEILMLYLALLGLLDARKALPPLDDRPPLPPPP